MDYKEKLKNFEPAKDFFIGVDSDGCAFPTMELKHKECFIPNIIKYWKLQSISKYAREIAEWVNLYSIYRGTNRFIALVKTIELLAERKEAVETNIKLPDITPLKNFINSGLPLSNYGLIEYMKTNKNATLELALEWSEQVNKDIADMVHGVAPFSFAKKSLEKMRNVADVIVVSATPLEALEKEWKEHDIEQYVKIIAGQEMGSKKEHLEMAAKGKYKERKILMIGDAPGDHKSAQAVDALFYPINPGAENKSWERFYNEALDKFLNSEYDGEYQDKVIKEFYKFLPETPYWEVLE